MVGWFKASTTGVDVLVMTSQYHIIGLHRRSSPPLQKLELATIPVERSQQKNPWPSPSISDQCHSSSEPVSPSSVYQTLTTLHQCHFRGLPIFTPSPVKSPTIFTFPPSLRFSKSTQPASNRSNHFSFLDAIAANDVIFRAFTAENKQFLQALFV